MSKTLGKHICHTGPLATDDVAISGQSKTWERIADSRHKATYQFCPQCGSTLAYVLEDRPGVIAIPVGNFQDPNFPAPSFSVYEHRKHNWVKIPGDNVEHTADPGIAFTRGKLPDG